MGSNSDAMKGILQQIKSQQLPDHAKRAVVQGIMPLETEELVEALFLICSEDESLLELAGETYEGLPDAFKKTFFEDRDLTPDLLAFFLIRMEQPVEALSSMLLNPALPAPAIRQIAPRLDVALLDIVVNNQVKILEDPSIIEALRTNGHLSINQKQKLDDYERLLLKDLVSPAAELETKSIEEIEQEAIAEAKDFVKLFGKEKESQPKRDHGRKAESEGKEEGRVSVLEQLTSMSVPQKIQAAIKGDREVRGILVRDANKMVCTAVIKSPRITEAEVEFYSNLRNVQTDVLRIIANNREWMRNYKIVSNLVHNPRTPLTFSMKLIHRLNSKDIRNLVRDRGVPEALRTTARRMNQQQR